VSERGPQTIRTEVAMAKTSPWYSKKTMDVHHNETECTTGNNIEPENIAYGTGDLSKCSECKSISG
jgi:hypothetical protein